MLLAAGTPSSHAVFTQFAQALDSLGPFEHAPHLAVAVSGGADSTALCLMAHEWARARGGRITALTVDHGLRAESAEEVRRVASMLHTHGISCETFRIHVAPTGNLQANARAARYGCLLHWCNQHHVLHLLTGHHAADLAETSALHQLRGITADGASGLAAASIMGGVRLLRPLLGAHKSDLMGYLEHVNVAWIEDPSNETTRFARGRLRKTLPLNSTYETALREGHARNQRDTQLAFDAARCAALYPEGYGSVARMFFATLPPERGSLLLANMLRTIGGKSTRARGHETLRLYERLCVTETFSATLAGCTVSATQNTVLIMRELSRIAPYPITTATGSAHVDGRFQVHWCGLSNSGYRIAPLGTSYKAALGDTVKLLPRHMPKAVISRLLALWHLDQVRFVPHIEVAQCASPYAGAIRIAFSPPKPLAASAFWCLN